MVDYAVGDIQGCYEALLRSLDQAGFDPATDRLWSVGDLVNRGPGSLQTLRFLKGLNTSFTAVLGNHDLHLLALASGAAPAGKKKYLQAILDAPDCAELCGWLRGLPLMHTEEVLTEEGRERFVMVHAGIPPLWSLPEAEARAREVEAVLRGPDWVNFLGKMYGDLPDTWDDALEGPKRLRLITNYFTRMRFCNAAGKLNLAVKTGAGTAPKGYRPWYEFQRPEAGTVILFGHWATLDGVTGYPDIHALDTGCVWGRKMTLLRLQDKQRLTLPGREGGSPRD